MDKFTWMNESAMNEEDGKIVIYAPENTDFFCNIGASGEEGITPASLCNAPFYFTEITGDFVLRSRVSHNFKDTYDSASLMVMSDMQNWGKLCFELTDFNTHAVVSVVTRNGESDDANGCNVAGDSVWLQIVRVGNAFAFHYSIDDKKYYMVRVFTIPAGESVKVGLLPQAPLGGGGNRCYQHLQICNKSVKNIRMGE